MKIEVCTIIIDYHYFCLPCHEKGLNKIFCTRIGCCKVLSGRRVFFQLYSHIIRLELPPCQEKGRRDDAAVKFSVENCFIAPYLMAQHEY